MIQNDKNIVIGGNYSAGKNALPKVILHGFLLVTVKVLNSYDWGTLESIRIGR